MKFVFRIVLANNTEVREGFYAETEEQARAEAVEWAGEDALVGECVERWSVNV